MDHKEIRSLIQLLEETGLTEIEIEEHGKRVRLRKEQGHSATLPILSVTSVPQVKETLQVVQGPACLPPTEEAKKEPDRHLVAIHSPIVGTFYRSHQQGADPYVRVGDAVKKGQILCIVEAMKLMNEIESELNGTVAEICVEDKASVEFGQSLFKIDPKPV
jgi:acetyl-CoA carboxylase biotin carboxyl carrier protein